METLLTTDSLEQSQAKIDDYLAAQSQLDLLRFITCGSVDDGKSTLIGRMLYEAQLIFEDQVTALQTDSKKWAPRAAISTLRYWWTASQPNASRALPSMSRTVFLTPIKESSSWLTPQATSNTPAIW